jgi:hypothetical protein
LDNPGVYVSHVETSAWPLLYFFGSLAFAGVLVLTVMMFIAGGARWRRPVSGVLSLVMIAGLAATFTGMGDASARYGDAEAGAYSDYVVTVQHWLEEENSLSTDTTTVASLLRREPENVLSDTEVVPIRFDFNYGTDEIVIVHLSAPVLNG